MRGAIQITWLLPSLVAMCHVLPISLFLQLTLLMKIVLMTFDNSLWYYWRRELLSVWLQSSQEEIQVETSLDTAAVLGLRKCQIVWKCPAHVHYVTLRFYVILAPPVVCAIWNFDYNRLTPCTIIHVIMQAWRGFINIIFSHEST